MIVPSAVLTAADSGMLFGDNQFDRVTCRTVPITVKIGRNLTEHLSNSEYIKISKINFFVDINVLITDIAPTKIANPAKMNNNIQYQ